MQKKSEHETNLGEVQNEIATLNHDEMTEVLEDPAMMQLVEVIAEPASVSVSSSHSHRLKEAMMREALTVLDRERKKEEVESASPRFALNDSLRPSASRVRDEGKNHRTNARNAKSLEPRRLSEPFADQSSTRRNNREVRLRAETEVVVEVKVGEAGEGGKSSREEM